MKLFDLHQDIPTYLDLNKDGLGKIIGEYVPFEKEVLSRHGDMPSFKKANVKLIVNSFFFLKGNDIKSALKNGRKLEDSLVLKTRGELEKNVESFNKFIDEYGVFETVKSSFQLEDVMSTDKIGLLYHVEGLYSVDDLKDIDWLYSLGFRSFGLTWNKSNNICGTCLEEKGLSEFGEKVVKNLFDKDVIVDLTHSSKQTFWDVLKIKKTPKVYYSHSSLDQNGKCFQQAIDKNMLEELKKAKGLMGLTLLPCICEKNNYEMFKQRIAGLVKQGFGDCLAFGTDYFGFSFKESPEGLENIQSFAKLYKDLGQEISKEVADKVFFENALGFLVRNL